MKITYVFPPLGHAGRRVASMPLAPPVLEYLAGLTAQTRPDCKISLVNANVEDFSPGSVVSDIIGITVLTHQASWAYRAADELREMGVTVVLGGPHVSSLPEEAKNHADAVIVGEAESVMEALFQDIEGGGIRPFYRGEFLPLSGLPFPRRDLLKGYRFHSFFTSRGCPYRCKFCTTPKHHGRTVRYRPVGEVVQDIASFKHKMWFSTDADIWGPDVPRYIELFREMSVSLPGIYWIGEGSISSVSRPRGEEMLRWARKSGLMQVWIGWESFSGEILDVYGATSKMPKNREDALRKIRDNGIDVVLFLMMGAKGESLEEYQRAVEMCDRLSVTAHPVMVVPYPGTELYDEWKDHIIYGDNWDFYDGMHSMVRDGGVDNGVRDKALTALWNDLFSFPKIFGRMKGVSLRGFPSAHIASFIVQYALMKAFNQYIKGDTE